ncbi:MAG: methylenetetrahydrofolate reductase C-terminal domain-containing protein [Oscillospiraceae bacterium]|nr:methylenetetrahydrofolate reductase C-terminal domain-containing protein [Oscillospiraceae bacterium]
MIEYTKFKLKSRNELTELFEDKKSFTLLACNKCFKTFTLDAEPEGEELINFLGSLDKRVLAFYYVDFLCNKTRTTRLLEEISPQGTLVVVSCGLGAQTVGGLVELPVYTACDSVADGTSFHSGQHSVAPSSELCAGCGNCLLGETFGVCPVTDCVKGLLNGECGGAANGKCEVDTDRDCAWAKINERGSSGSLPTPSPNSLKTRNFLNVVPGSSLKISSEISKKRLDGFYGGVYIKDCKEFSDFLPLEDFSTLHDFPASTEFPTFSSFVTIPMSQHKGTSADPVVQVGDYVKIGQKIGEAVGTLSSSIHSSVSGRVTAISFCSHPNLSAETLAITIESDGKNEVHSSVRPIGYWEDLDIFDIDAIIAEKGIVGMGGAGFPTPVKLKNNVPIHTILINGCESEPYITADHRVMLEFTDEILEGLKIIMKSTGAEHSKIVIGANKWDAVELFLDRVSELPNIEIFPVVPKYPQGSERMLLQRVLGIKLGAQERPNDIGVIVLNVSTTKAIGDAFLYGMPLIKRAVTVSGENCMKPGNYMVPIGTSIRDVLHFTQDSGAVPLSYQTARAGGKMPPQQSKTEEPSHCLDPPSVVLGGPMMGTVINDFDIPVIKGTHGIIIQHKVNTVESDCIRCGRCVDVCPIMLLPLYFSPHFKNEDYDKMAEFELLRCIECGCCDYICPSRIEIRRAIKDAKKKLL